MHGKNEGNGSIEVMKKEELVGVWEGAYFIVFRGCDHAPGPLTELADPRMAKKASEGVGEWVDVHV